MNNCMHYLVNRPSRYLAYLLRLTKHYLLLSCRLIAIFHSGTHSSERSLSRTERNLSVSNSVLLPGPFPAVTCQLTVCSRPLLKLHPV